jgi:6-phosphogluconolactonase
MKLVKFNTLSEMQREATALLTEHFGLACPEPHAVMLTGGRTPLGVYRALERSPVAAGDSLHLLISDERHVPENSFDSNYAKMHAMVRALGLDDSRVMRVRTELPLEAAADRYHQELATYLENGGRITLGILGVGADGHVASLFDEQDLRRGAGRYAIAVARESGPNRVSVTRDLLLKVESLVFLAAGREKAGIVETILADPGSVVAGRAVRGISQIELWYSAHD